MITFQYLTYHHYLLAPDLSIPPHLQNYKGGISELGARLSYASIQKRRHPVEIQPIINPDA
jgi:hypothetical protein